MDALCAQQVRNLPSMQSVAFETLTILPGRSKDCFITHMTGDERASEWQTRIRASGRPRAW